MRRLILFINILFAVALLVCYLSPYVAPKYGYVFQVFGLFYSYIAVINVLFIIFWIFFKFKNIKYSLLALLIGFGFISRAYKWNGKSTNSKEQTFKLLTYNVKKFGISSNGRTTSPTPLFQFVEEQKAAIVCFQEYDHSRYQKYGKSLLKKHYSFLHRNGEIATFSKYPIIGKQNIPFDPKHHAKGIISDIIIQKDTLRILNVHLESNQLSPQNKKDFENFVSKPKNLKKLRIIGAKLKRAALNRAIQIDKLASIVKDSPFPVILCGDFNDTPLSYSYQRMQNLLDDSFVEAGENTGSTFAEGSIKVRIDYIFSKLKFAEHKVHDLHYSDHKAVTVRCFQNLE